MRGCFGVRLVAAALILSFLAGGCSREWRRKFIRKPKDVQRPQAVLVLESDVQATHPPDVRYREHFAYWKSWHSELLASFGQIRKRDLAYLNGCIGELRSLAGLLSGPPARRLQEILKEMEGMRAAWEGQPQTGYATAAGRGRLEKIQREVNKHLHYSKVKDWIPSAPPGKS